MGWIELRDEPGELGLIPLPGDSLPRALPDMTLLLKPDVVWLAVDWADLEDWLAQLPSVTRATLAAGPIHDEEESLDRTGESCRVCQALRPLRTAGNSGAWFLSIWHAEDMSAPPGQLEQECCYLRCITIYMAAGWPGVER